MNREIKEHLLRVFQSCTQILNTKWEPSLNSRINDLLIGELSLEKADYILSRIQYYLRKLNSAHPASPFGKNVSLAKKLVVETRNLIAKEKLMGDEK